MVRIAICDDDVKETGAAEEVIRACCRKEEKICECRAYSNSKALLYEVEEGEYFDILLLDIEMPQMDGMALTGEIKKYLPDALVIFVTSYEKYVFKAFEVQPFRFVPKKFREEMLPAAVTDAMRLALDRDGKFYVAENQRQLEKIPLRSITYIWHQEKYAYIEKTNGEHTKVRRTLRQVYKELPQEDFMWMDRGCIVNLSQIARINGEDLILTDGTRLNVSRDRLTELKNRVREYWMEKGGLR